MRKTAFHLTAMLTISVALNAGQTSGDSPSLGITVFVYNYAGVEQGSLERAERIAGQTFRHAGIEIAWVGCPTTEQERSKYTACRTKDGPRPLVLRIMPKAPDQFTNYPHVFGAAYLGDGSKRATVADIFLDRVEKATMEKLYSGLDRVMASPLPSSFRPGVTLGVVLGHEIGHLLLGSNSHTRQGIMRPSWGRQELEDAYLGRQQFTLKQVSRMRVDVVARARSGSPPVSTR